MPPPPEVPVVHAPGARVLARLDEDWFPATVVETHVDFQGKDWVWVWYAARVDAHPPFKAPFAYLDVRPLTAPAPPR